MKKLYLTYFSLFFFICSLFAQQPVAGVYKSEKDYASNTISYIINCNSQKGKIKLHHFFSKNYIDIINKGEKIKLYKDSIFGYRDCKQMDYRFYKNNEDEYKIVETKSLVIYTSYISVTSANGKANELKTGYFFSASLNAPILPLTVLNLKRTFPDNLKFHALLDITFTNESTISAYDSAHKMYTANFLLNKSLNN